MGQFITPDVLPPDTFCRRLFIPNDPKWIGTVSGALMVLMFASEWQEVEGITAEAAAARAKVMLDDFWADNGCGGDDMDCCADQVVLHRYNPTTGAPEVSLDNGVTWTPDPASIEFQVQLYPPLVHEGSSHTKCDAATNASEHINELIDATHTNIETAGTIFELATAVAAAVLALFLILVSAGTLTAPVTAVATAIWAAASAAFELGAEAFDAYWTVDKKDAILCALFCNIGADGQFTEAQYQAFRAKVKDQLPGSPALDIVMTSINSGGARGLSQMASYGAAAEADCSDCDCDDCVDQCDAVWTFYNVTDVVFDGCNTYHMVGMGGAGHFAFSSGDQAVGCYYDVPLLWTTGSFWPVGSPSPVSGTNPKTTPIWNFDIGPVALGEEFDVRFSSAPLV